MGLTFQSVHIYSKALDALDEIREMNQHFQFLYAGIINSDDQFGKFLNLHKTIEEFSNYSVI